MRVKYVGRRKSVSHDWGRERYSWNENCSYVADIPQELYGDLTRIYLGDYIAIADEPEPIIEKVVEKVYVCFLCHDEFPSAKAMLSHYKVAHTQDLKKK